MSRGNRGHGVVFLGCFFFFSSLVKVSWCRRKKNLWTEQDLLKREECLFSAYVSPLVSWFLVFKGLLSAVPVVFYCSLQDPRNINGIFFFLRNGTGSAKSSHLTGNHTEGRRFAEIQYSLPAEVVLGGNPPAGGCFGRRGVPRRVPSILSIPTGYRNREILNTVLWGVTAFSKRVSLDVRDNNASRELVPPPGGVKPTAHYMTLHMIVYTFLIPWWWCPCMIGIIYIHFFFPEAAWDEM